MRRRGTRASRAAAGKRFVLLVSRFHPALGRALVRGATAVLRRAGVSAADIRVVWVPGAFELPVVAASVARTQPRPHAMLALGALIRGETVQYEVLANAVTQGLLQVSLQERLPVTCGVIVAESPAQARARAGGSMGNRGAEAALAALAVLKLVDKLK